MDDLEERLKGDCAEPFLGQLPIDPAQDEAILWRTESATKDVIEHLVWSAITLSECPFPEAGPGPSLIGTYPSSRVSDAPDAVTLGGLGDMLLNL